MGGAVLAHYTMLASVLVNSGMQGPPWRNALQGDILRMTHGALIDRAVVVIHVCRGTDSNLTILCASNQVPFTLGWRDHANPNVQVKSHGCPLHHVSVVVKFQGYL